MNPINSYQSKMEHLIEKRDHTTKWLESHHLGVFKGLVIKWYQSKINHLDKKIMNIRNAAFKRKEGEEVGKKLLTEVFDLNKKFELYIKTDAKKLYEKLDEIQELITKFDKEDSSHAFFKETFKAFFQSLNFVERVPEIHREERKPSKKLDLPEVVSEDIMPFDFEKFQGILNEITRSLD